MSGRLHAAITEALRLALLYAATCTLGLALLAVAFASGLFHGIDILFYRGLVLVALVFIATFGVVAALIARSKRGSLALRDAFAAAVLSLSLNLSFLVLVPVTVDRSISIFVLAQLAAHSDRSFTADEMSSLFADVYVAQRHQIARRLEEQLASGNVSKNGAAYRIGPHGKAIVEVARIVARVFGTRADILTPAALGPADTTPETQPAR